MQPVEQATSRTGFGCVRARDGDGGVLCEWRRCRSVDTPEAFDSLYIRRPRAWLAAILVAYLVSAVLYAWNTPAWQAPDEPAHYNYIAHIAEQGFAARSAHGRLRSVAARSPDGYPIQSARRLGAGPL